MRLITLICTFLVVSSSLALAEIRTITATGEYRMGDNDNRTDAKRLALQDAKRLALEQAGTYLESVTEIKNFQIARDELRAYTAGIVEVMEQQTRSTMEGETTIVRVVVTCRIDSGVLVRQIDSLRRNETIKAELVRARDEADRWRQKAESKTQELASIKSKADVKIVTDERRKAITQAEIFPLIMQASVALYGASGSIGASSHEGKVRARRLIEQALALDPDSALAHCQMGLLLYEERNIEAAVAEFRTGIQLDGFEIVCRNNFGNILAKIGKVEDADRELTYAILLSQLSGGIGTFTARMNLGDILFEKGNLCGALGQYRYAVSIAKDKNDEGEIAEATFRLGAALGRSGDHEAAIAAYREVIRLAPLGFSRAHWNLATELLEQQKFSEGAVELREYLKTVPNSPAFQQNIEQARALLGQLEECLPKGCEIVSP